MTRRFFEGVKDVQELRKKYKELLKQYHPDNGGSVEIMQEINSEYDRLFKALPKDSTENAKSAAGAAGASTSADGVTDAMRAVLEKLAGLAGITIEICGSWVWVSGDTYPVKDIIKAAGCFFSSKKKMWYWREEKEGWHGRRGGADMATIRLKYGSQSYTGTAQKELA